MRIERVGELLLGEDEDKDDDDEEDEGAETEDESREGEQPRREILTSRPTTDSAGKLRECADKSQKQRRSVASCCCCCVLVDGDCVRVEISTSCIGVSPDTRTCVCFSSISLILASRPPSSICACFSNSFSSASARSRAALRLSSRVGSFVRSSNS